MHKLSFLRCFSAAALVLALLSQAQIALAGTTGNLSGVVVDAATGAPVAGATVTVTSPSDSRSSKTDASGSFAFLSLASDTYVVSIEGTGFDSTSESGVSVFADQTQRLNVRLNKSLRTIGTVKSRSSNDLVRPGTTTDSYSVNAATQAAAVGLGGGGSLNQAYSALATVPGVSVPAGQNGWSQTAGVTIRGGTHTQIGYEFDGVPTNVGINFFPGSGLSTLGQQELQVYTGSAPVSSESQGLSGFINQVIKTGTMPGFADGDLGLGNPFYHKAAFEFGGMTTNRNFSYYVGFLGANQSFRDVDQYNGASYTNTYGTVFAALPCPGNATDLNYASCYKATTPNGLGVGPGGFAHAPPNYGNAAYQEDRENVVNLHLALPHKNGGLKDDVQLLYDTGGIETWLYSSQNDLPAADLAIVGGAYTFPSGYVYNGALGQALPANYASLVSPYHFPTQDTASFGNGGYVPADRRDNQINNQSIVKLQYQHNIDAESYFRAYAYTLYANFELTGANGASSPLGIGNPGDYKLWTHTSGFSTEYANQISPTHLLQADGSYTLSPSVRDNSNPFYTGEGTAFAYAVNSANPASGICYSVAGTTASPVSCEPGGAASVVTYANAVSGAPVTPLAGVTCGSGPCEYYVAENGQRGTLNAVQENTVSASIRDQWHPNAKLSIDYGLKFHEYLYQGADTTGGTRDFWFNAFNQAYCVNSTPGNSPVTKTSLGLGINAACSAANIPGASYITPTLSNAPANYAYPEFEPRLGATYSLGSNDVLRGSLGKYTQSAESGFQQYNTLQQNLPLYLGQQFYKYSLETPGHNIKPQESYNFDFSWEHAFKGTDVAFKVTPYYRTTNNELTEFFINPAEQTTSGLAVGSLRADGVEFQLKKGSFDRNGFSAQLSYTYTDARIKYNTLPNGGNILSPINVDIQTYNGYTSYCSTHPTDNRCGPTTAASGKAAACFTPAGVPDPSCAAGDVANPYWNAPVQNLLDPNGSYWPTDPVVATTGLGVNSYTVPHVATLMLNYRRGPFAITPSVQFQAGQRYGAPEANAGIDPAGGCAALAGASTTGDPRYPYGAAGGAPFDALSCNAALNAIPDTYTGKFDGIGAFTSPSQLLGSVNFSYDATKNVGFTLTVSNLFDQCFGGSNEPWTGVGGPHVCSYVNGEVSRAYVPTGNAYNPGAKFDPYAQYPYNAYLGPYTMGVVSPSSPLSVFINMHVKL